MSTPVALMTGRREEASPASTLPVMRSVHCASVGAGLSVVDCASRGLKFSTDCRGDWAAPVIRGEGGDFWPLQELVDGRQLA